MNISLLPLLFLIGFGSLSLLEIAINLMGFQSTKERFLHTLLPPLRPLLSWLSSRQGALALAIRINRLLYTAAYVVSAFFWLSTHLPLIQTIVLTILTALLFEFLLNSLAIYWIRPLFAATAWIAAIAFTITSPLIALLFQATRCCWPRIANEGGSSAIQEMIHSSQNSFDHTDQKLISAFIHFKEKVAKEIMVPRVDLFSLPADLSIQEAAQLFAQEGYSRVPIFRETLDQIIGVVLYKDLIKCYTNPDSSALQESLETIQKPILYVPENKKISHLLQEFRTKQIHLAIVVDEYGGTEGIVTIEDILEELVGEIEDEYDIGGEQFWPLPSGGWIVDAKMSINDIQEELGVQIPESPDYETLGGYISQKAGVIPEKGWRLLHDEFEIEVLNASDRSVTKVKLVPKKSAS